MKKAVTFAAIAALTFFANLGYAADPIKEFDDEAHMENMLELENLQACYWFYDCCTYKCHDYAPEVPEEEEAEPVTRPKIVVS